MQKKKTYRKLLLEVDEVILRNKIWSHVRQVWRDRYLFKIFWHCHFVGTY